MFYGWRTVALGFLNNSLSAGVGTYAFSVFVKPVTGDAGLGWSRTELMLGVTLGVILATLSGLIAGKEMNCET